MDIIKNNPYRVLGILVNTSIKEEHSKTKKLKMYVEAEKEVPEDFSFPILGNLNRNISNIDNAISKLNLNNDRVNASIFWFYIGNSITDEPMFDALKVSKEEAKGAIITWEKLTVSKEITKRNASAFQNLSTFYLNDAYKKSTISKNKLAKGIQYKLIFLESDFIKDFIKHSSDETYKVSKEEIQIHFLKEVYSQIEKVDNTQVDWYLDLISKLSFTAKQNYLNDFVSKPTEAIKVKIEETKTKRKANPASASILGQDLYESTNNSLNTIKNILGVNNIKFSSISDKLSDEILQCGISYFKKYRDTKTDPSEFTLNLFKKAKGLAIGSIAKQRCQENTEILQEWIDEKPERDKQKKISVDFERIINILKIYDQRNENISNANGLVNDAKPHLNHIKSVLGDKDELYLKLSTRIASQALACTIEEVNLAQSTIQNSFQLVSFKVILRSAILIANELKNFDLEYDFRVNRFNENHSTLKNLCNQLNVSIYSPSITTPGNPPRSTPPYIPPREIEDEGIPGWLKVVGLIILFVFLSKACS
jgi:hypothetical protein